MRRVVCGHRADGSDGVLIDGPPSSVSANAGYVFTDVWSVDSPSVDTTDRTEQTSISDICALPHGSSRFRVGVFPPMEQPEIWHRTDSVDYEYVISGEIDLFMDDGTSVTLRAGDCNVQLGGNHQWWNKSDEPCVMAIVMIGVHPEPG
jgi:mannose-6-phosphate isomerase-like protein (cupin superfamily)